MSIKNSSKNIDEAGYKGMSMAVSLKEKFWC